MIELVLLIAMFSLEAGNSPQQQPPLNFPTQAEIEEASLAIPTPELSPLSRPEAQSLTALEERAARQSQKSKRRCCFGCK